jgi:CheY-like chemotaxis protein
MSTLPNVWSDAARAPQKRVLLLAHPELGAPTARYLRDIDCKVTFPSMTAGRTTAEDCAALLFPNRSALDCGDERRLTDTSPLFMWSAFDAVVIQDLWPSVEEQRLIAFGCTVAATDYYVRGNFNQPKIVIVTDPAFYGGCLDRTDAACERSLRERFDQNEQIDFVPVLGAESSLSALERIGGAVIRTAKRSRVLNSHDGLPFAMVDCGEQRRGMAVLSSALVRYVTQRARVVVIDDSPRTITSIAGRFDEVIKPDKEDAVHVYDVKEKKVTPCSSFGDLQSESERLVAESRHAHELLLVVTDILFDGVDWHGDGGRKTGVDLIHLLRKTQRDGCSKVGIVGLTGVASPLVMTSAFQRGADAIVTKSSRDGTSLNHARDVDESVMYKLLLTLGFLCFQSEFLAGKRHVPPDHAREELAALRRILPAYAVSPHLQAEWEATQYLLESQATYAQNPRLAERSINRILQQYD